MSRVEIAEKVHAALFSTNLANQQKIISEHYIALASFTDPLVKVTGISDIKAQFRALTYFKKIAVKKHSITTSSLNDAEVVVIDATISYNIFWMFYLHVRTVTKFEFAASGLIRRQEDLWSIADMVGALPLVGYVYNQFRLFLGVTSSKLLKRE
ncbi:hypothetical protein HDV04_003712 [Boothiomyces sp. JEL0838]|nr:hypothetical protein HDV04_003712 [Boothiomyces sp. JEL0838]